MSLLDAVLSDDVELVTKHLSSGNINQELPDAKCTPLMAACSHSSLKVINYLLEHGADVNSVSSKGLTPLMKAVQSECSEKGIQVIKLLLAKGADLELVNTDGYTALAMACAQGKLEFVLVLLSSDAAVNCHCKSPLQLTVHYDNAEIAKELLAKGAEIVFEDTDMFRLAVAKGNFEMVRVFLEANRVTGLNDASNGDTWSYLMEACFHGHDKVIKVLLEYKADVNLIHKSGNFALKVAAYYSHVKTVELLLDNNADVNLKGPDGCNALMSAVESDISSHKEEIVQILIDGGTDISSENSSGMTALEVAILSQSRGSVEMLLKEGVEVNHQCEDGWYPMQTPLMMACQFGTKEIVELLLGYKANVNLQDKSGGYALFYAIEQYNYEVRDLLLSLPHINANLVTNDGRSAAKLQDAHDNALQSEMVGLNSGLSRISPDGRGIRTQKVVPLHHGKDDVDYSPVDMESCVHRIHITHGSVNHPYVSIFRPCFHSSVRRVEIDDAYIRKPYQFRNLEKLCKILKRHCRKLARVTLTTSDDCPHSQRQYFCPIIQRLKESHVVMDVHYSGTMHDREVRFSNGWIVKMGRGLDIYLSEEDDDASRQCRETKIEIFHKTIVYNRY